MRVENSAVVFGHNQKPVISYRPMRLTVFEQTWFEIEKRVIRLEVECRNAFFSHHGRLDVFVPVELGAQHDVSRFGRISNANSAAKNSLGSVQLSFRTHKTGRLLRLLGSEPVITIRSN
jgi:hypothetical protein